jgi:hypothetical protein
MESLDVIPRRSLMTSDLSITPTSRGATAREDARQFQPLGGTSSQRPEPSVSRTGALAAITRHRRLAHPVQSGRADDDG